MQTRRFFAALALTAAPLAALIATAGPAAARMPQAAPPPVPYFDCKALHTLIGAQNDWLTGHASYNNSGDASKQQEYNDHFDMMGSMQRQGIKEGCYKNGMPVY